MRVADIRVRSFNSEAWREAFCAGGTRPWFIDSAKIGSGARCDTGAYDIDKTLCLLGDPQPAIVSATAFRGIDMPAGNKVDIDCCNYNWVIILE